MPWSKGFFDGFRAYTRTTASDAYRAYRNGGTVYVANAFCPPKRIPENVRLCDWVDKFQTYWDGARPCYYIAMNDAMFEAC